MSDMIPEQYKQRVYTEVMKSATPENLKKAIKEKRVEYYKLKAKNAGYAVKHAIEKIKTSKKFKKSLESKMSNKAVMRSGKQVTVVENQPIYSDDRSRFFKTAWKEDKRQLYFD